MVEQIEFTYEDGDKDEKDVTVYALSTCGFCRRGMEFLRKNSVKFKFIYIDQLEYEVKQKLKAKLKEKFEKRVAFPFLVIDNKEAIFGFVKDVWKKHLGL